MATATAASGSVQGAASYPRIPLAKLCCLDGRQSRRVVLHDNARTRDENVCRNHTVARTMNATKGLSPNFVLNLVLRFKLLLFIVLGRVGFLIWGQGMRGGGGKGVGSKMSTFV